MLRSLQSFCIPKWSWDAAVALLRGASKPTACCTHALHTRAHSALGEETFQPRPVQGTEKCGSLHATTACLHLQLQPLSVWQKPAKNNTSHLQLLPGPKWGWGLMLQTSREFLLPPPSAFPLPPSFPSLANSSVPR